LYCNDPNNLQATSVSVSIEIHSRAGNRCAHVTRVVPRRDGFSPGSFLGGTRSLRGDAQPDEPKLMAFV
jgi:hypothetical protein